MALTFYWRCTSATLDATHDYSAGATTMTAAGAVSITGDGVTNTDGVDYYYCASAGIVSAAAGSLAFKLKQVSALAAVGFPIGAGIEQNAYTATDNWLFPRSVGTDELAIGFRKAGSALQTLATTTLNWVADTEYFVVISWDFANDKRRVRVYSEAGSLLQEVEDTTTDLSAFEPASIDRFFVGQRGSSPVVCNVKNVFCGSAYDDADAFYSNRDITSFTQYGSAAATVWPQYHTRHQPLLRL